MIWGWHAEKIKSWCTWCSTSYHCPGIERDKTFRYDADRKKWNRVKDRSFYCYFAVRELGISISEISRKLEMSLAGENKSLKRSKRMADCNGIVTDFSLEPKSVTMNFSNIRQCNPFLTAYLVIKRIILFKQLQLTYNHNIANLLISNTNKELMIDLQNAAW